MSTILSRFKEVCHNLPTEKSCLRRITSTLESEILTYGDLDRKSDAFASRLSSFGCKKGDRVLILSGNSCSIFTAFWGSMKAGGIPCVLYPSFGSGGIFQRLELAQANFFCLDGSPEKYAEFVTTLPDFKGFIDMNELPECIEGTPSDFVPHPDDPAFMIFTSGSTGTPKPILHRQGMAEAVCRSMRNVLHASPEDVYWCTAHPAWITGTVYGMIGPLLCGMETIQYDGNFHPKRWMPILHDQKVSLWYSAPTAFRSLMRETADFFVNYNFSALKQIYSIGEPLPTAVSVWGMETFGKPIFDTWFQTETGTIRIAAQPSAATVFGSMGRPVDDSEVLILDETDQPVSDGRSGRLCLRLPWDSCCLGVYNGGALSRMRSDYYETGDLARQDADGNLFFSGRADDVINTSGHLVGPMEIESVLLMIPEVFEVGVTSEPDPLTWEHPVAFVVLAEGVESNRALEMKLRTCVSQGVSAYAIPKRFIYLSALPHTENGKLNRSALKKLL